MINKKGLSSKLYLLLVVMAVSIIAIGIYGVSELKRMKENIQSIYEDRVLPINQLAGIRYSNMRILTDIQSVKSGALDNKRALQNIEEAQNKIKTNWDAYLLTNLSPKEGQLANQEALLIGKLSESIEELKDFLKAKENRVLDTSTERKISTNINEVIYKVNELMNLQVSVSGDVYKKSADIYNSSLNRLVLTIILSLFFIITFSCFLVRNVKNLFGELQESNLKIASGDEKYRSLVDHAADAIFVINNDFTISELNESAVKLLGYSRDEFFVMKIMQIFNCDDLAKRPMQMDRLLEEKTLLTERKLVRKDGADLDVEFNIKVLDGNRYLAVARDITQRKKSEESLKNISTRLQLATHSANIGIFDWDIVNDVLTWDGNMFKIFGILPENFAGNYESWCRTLHLEDLENAKVEMQGAIDGKEEFHHIFRIIKYRTENCWIESHAIILRNDQGRAIRMIGVNRDISDIKKASEELLKMNARLEERVVERTSQFEEANSELSSFSYSVSHDMRTPLRAVNGYAKILEEDYFDVLDDNAKEMVKSIQDNSKRMGQLIDDLLSFSRLARKDLAAKEVNMERLVKSIINKEIMNERGRAEIVINTILPAVGDEDLIKLVWKNLISNAFKYSKNKPLPKIEFGSSIKNNTVEYYIKDNGAGFDMKYYDKMFGVFQRLHTSQEFEGRGIGLATVKKIIQRHKGEAWAESKLKKGSVFYFTLDAVKN